MEIDRQITDFLTKSNMISPNHHSVILGKSTITMEESKVAASIIVDQSAVYDVIPHDKLHNPKTSTFHISTSKTIKKTKVKQW